MPAPNQTLLQLTQTARVLLASDARQVGEESRRFAARAGEEGMRSFFDWLLGRADYIVFVVPTGSSLWDELGVIEEGVWKKGEIAGYSYRIDPTDPQKNILRHVHVAKDKHTRTKNKQWSWNQDGTRHDKHSFNPSVNGLEKAKTVARAALGLKPDFKLDHLQHGDQLLLEGSGVRPSVNCVVFAAKE